MFSHRFITLLALASGLSPLASAASTANIYEDLFAHPQYEITFSTDPLTPTEASTLISSPPPSTTYETLIFSSLPFLCSVPIPPPPPPALNTTERLLARAAESEAEALAAKNGLELVKTSMDKKCLYYTADWWSYSFCYPDQLRQFHAKPVPQGGKPVWPPREDPDGLTYVLGRGSVKVGSEKKEKERDVAVKTNGETKFLVEKWGGGTICDLTGRPRTVEVHWFCGEGGERIGGVREIATCVYAVTVFSERLCDEKTFLPAEREKGERIVCREVVGERRERVYEEFRKRMEKVGVEAEERFRREFGDDIEVEEGDGEILVKDEL